MDKDFILEIPNNLSEKFCNIIIEQFEKDDRKKDGSIGSSSSSSRIDKTVKTSIDLCLNDVKNDTSFWNDVDKVLSRKLTDAVIQYKKHIDEKYNDCRWSGFLNDMYDTGYQIQRTDPGGFYTWHHDFTAENSSARFLTFIWYLNTLEKDQGGNTEIIGGVKIRPETGKLLIFPSTWTAVHRGAVLKYGKKYLITGWLHNKA